MSPWTERLGDSLAAVLLICYRIIGQKCMTCSLEAVNKETGQSCGFVVQVTQREERFGWRVRRTKKCRRISGSWIAIYLGKTAVGVGGIRLLSSMQFSQ